MRALEPRALGDARHAAVLAREKMLEVHPLERFARLAIRTIEGYLRQRAGRRARGERALHVFELYFFLERREREVFHHAFQLGKVPRPWVMTQRVERGDRQPPRRAGARLDELCQHEGSQIRHVFGKLAQRRQPECQLRKASSQLDIEVMLLREAAHIHRRERHQPHLLLLGTRQQELEVTLLGPSEAAEVGDEQHAARRLAEELRGRLGQQLGAGEKWRPGGHQQPREELGPHAALAAQHQGRGRLRQLREALLGVSERRRAAKRGQRELRRCRGFGIAQRALHGIQQPLQSDRLFEEVERPDAGGLDCGFDGAVTRHHDHRHGELPACSPFLEQRNTVGIRHPDVEQDEVRAGALAQPARIACALGHHHLVSFVGQDLRQQFPDSDFVVDDQNLRHIATPLSPRATVRSPTRRGWADSRSPRCRGAHRRSSLRSPARGQCRGAWW